jgi:signal transduction histidine kinase
MVITGRMHLLEMKIAAGGDWRRDAEIIHAESARASRIARGLLDFAHKREPKVEPVDLNRVVTRALDLVGPHLKTHAVAVETRLAPQVPMLRGDDDQLVQVVLNLVNNAIDAMPNGGRLFVETDATPDAEAVALRVQDTGIGMSAEQVSRIFEPFYTTKAPGKGTGLGLPVILDIVKQHDRLVGVDSEPGRGTTVSVHLVAGARLPELAAAS